MKTPKASGALRLAPDPMPTYAHFTFMTPFCYTGKFGLTRVAPRPNPGSATEADSQMHAEDLNLL